jgi:XTP/dITP diphosphohydrolase
MFAAAGFEVIDLAEAGIVETPDEDAIEAFATFEENAAAKARYFAARSGLPTVADDSGLAVRALDDAPGVRSKRWAAAPGLTGQALDDANNAQLMAALRGTADRRARYVCVAAFRHDARETLCRGEVAGTIALAPSGTEGFGYDPYFVADELGRTFADATIEEKERVSHRGRAFRALIAELRAGRG